jgi:hypothetical protein
MKSNESMLADQLPFIVTIMALAINCCTLHFQKTRLEDSFTMQ